MDVQAIYIRVSPELKAAIENAARDADVSVNEFATRVLAEAAQRSPPDPGAARFDVDTSIGFLIARAVEGETTTYGELAKANGFERWADAWRTIAAHLYDVGRECVARSMPMLTSIVVSRSTGMPSEGLFRLARMIGADVADGPAFVASAQARVFAWGRQVKSGRTEKVDRWASVRGVWEGPPADELLSWTRGPPDETGA